MMKCGLFQQRGQFLCCFGLSVASSSVFLVLLLFFVLIFIQQMAFRLFITEYETEFLIDTPRRDATSELYWWHATVVLLMYFQFSRRWSCASNDWTTVDGPSYGLARFELP